MTSQPLPYKLSLFAAALLLAGTWPLSAQANISPIPIDHFIAFKPVKLAPNKPQPMPAAKAVTPENNMMVSNQPDEPITPSVQPAPITMNTPQKQFIQLDRRFLVPVRTRFTPVEAPLMNRRHPISQPSVSASNRPVAAAPSSASPLTMLDLFDRKSAPLPSSNFYKALRGMQ